MIKSLIQDIKDIDEKGIVTFYFAAFGNKDSDGDITMRGAFVKTMNDNKARIKHVLNHRTDQVPGVPIEMGEDEKGAWMRSKLMLATALGKDVYEMYKAGAITEHSFRYDIVKAYRDRQQDAQIIQEYKLWEASSLTAWGANSVTPVISVKSESDLLKELEEAIKSGKLQPDLLIKSLEKLPGFTALQPKSTGTEPITCKSCGYEFDYLSVPEAGMGYVKCPKCGKPVWPEKSDAVSYLLKNLKLAKNG